MTRKLFTAALLAISISALAYGGYRYIHKAHINEEKKPEAAQTEKSDQFAIKELVAVLKQFQQARTIDASFTTVLLGADGKTDMGSFSGHYIKDSMNLYIQSINSENLLNKDYFVAVDHEQKMVYVEKPELNQPSNFFHFGFLSDIDSLVKLPDSLVFYRQIDAHTARLILNWEYGNYYKTELVYDIQTKALRRVHLFPYQDVFMQPEEGEISDRPDLSGLQYGQEELPLYVAIIYDRIDLNKPVNRKWFNTDKYFTANKKQLQLTKAFKHYEIDYE